MGTREGSETGERVGEVRLCKTEREGLEQIIFLREKKGLTREKGKTDVYREKERMIERKRGIPEGKRERKVSLQGTMLTKGEENL